MNRTCFILPIVISSVIVAVIININNVSKICELDTCPLCYGEDLCEDLDKISLSYETISYLFYNVLSVKNVYFAKYDNTSVVLKKLAHNFELSQLDLTHCTTTGTLVNTYNHSYKLCDDHTVNLLLNQCKHLNTTNLCTILNVNIEPIILQLFDGFPVPKFYGSCGRIIVEENAGIALNTVQDFNWFDRAYIGYQLLRAAKQFTYDHNIFRLYLMDISPDNIVVGKDLIVSFIDLEHVILKAKERDPVGGFLHRSEDFQDEPYSFSEGDICDSDISDHNIYSVCKLLLSKSSPWPMMSGGLLHDPPSEVVDRHPGLFEGVELCVKSSNRFEVSDHLLEQLKGVISGKSYTL